MDVAEYWTGKGVDYESLWRSFDDGMAYADKFQSMTTHVLRIELAEYPKAVPLFNHEAVLKTIKGYFHDLKRACLPPDEYDRAGPLFLYSVNRGSGIWTFLGELRQLLILGTTLADEKVMGQRLSNLDKRLNILKRHFGDAVAPEAFNAFMNARTPRELEHAVGRLLQQGIRKVEVSKRPFRGKIKSAEASLVDLKRLTKGAG